MYVIQWKHKHTNNWQDHARRYFETFDQAWQAAFRIDNELREYGVGHDYRVVFRCRVEPAREAGEISGHPRCRTASEASTGYGGGV